MSQITTSVMMAAVIAVSKVLIEAAIGWLKSNAARATLRKTAIKWLNRYIASMLLDLVGMLTMAWLATQFFGNDELAVKRDFLLLYLLSVASAMFLTLLLIDYVRWKVSDRLPT